MKSTGKPLLGNSQKFVECAYGDRDFPESEEGNKGFNKSRSVQTSCAICQQPFILPVKAKCGHICCKLCWQKHLNVRQIALNTFMIIMPCFLDFHSNNFTIAQCVTRLFTRRN